jgi:hypothetical protein
MQAGCWGAVPVELRDRFNNLLGAEPAAELVLTAEGRGPGMLRTLVEPAGPDHPCRVFVKADVVGEYSVSVLMEKRIQVCDSGAKRKPRRSGTQYISLTGTLSNSLSVSTTIACIR